MALTQPLERFDSRPPDAQPVSRNNVIPFFRPARMLLPVSLPRQPQGGSCAPLTALLRSPLGVYVISTEVVHDEVRVQFDIAADDLDFTMHTLIATLPQAMIGSVKRHSTNIKAH